jgi:hypothetical protein
MQKVGDLIGATASKSVRESIQIPTDVRQPGISLSSSRWGIKIHVTALKSIYASARCSGKSRLPCIFTTTANPTMTKAESSKAAASNGVRANPNAVGGANYELPW